MVFDPASPDTVLLTDGAAGGAVADIALSHALLRSVAAGDRGRTLRVFHPRPTLAFGRLDARQPGFAAACAAAAALGFTPAVRVVGGRAAASHPGCVVVEEVTVERETGGAGLERRFDDQARRLARVLRALGADAHVGELPGEYCPGRHSVHAGGLKLVGTAQRVVRGAALTSAVVVVAGGPAVREVVTATYAALGEPVDPATAGALDELLPAVTPAAVHAAVCAAYGTDRRLTPGTVDDALQDAAGALVAQHTPGG
jgi:lipoate-protein ligase A